MASATVTIEVSQALRNLLRKAPLRPIRSDTECERVINVMQKMDRQDDLPEDAAAYLDVLATLVERYEDECYDFGHGTSLDMLKFLMEQHKMRPADLARILGCSHTLVSLMLSGDRGISKAHARILGERFHVNPAAFLFDDNSQPSRRQRN